MPHAIEKQIQHLLSEGLSPQQVAASLAERSLDGRVKDQNLEALCFYIYRIGEWKLLARLSLQLLKDNKQLALAPVILALKSDPNFSLEENLPFLIEASRELKQQQGLLQAATGIDSPELQELQSEFVETINTKYEERKQALLEKLEFFKSDELFEQENMILKQIKREFPEVKSLDTYFEDFKKRWADNLFNKKSISKEEDMFEQAPEFSDAEKQILDIVFEHSTKQAQAKPDSAYDFALLFYFIGAIDKAINLLSYADVSHNLEWLKLEWLIESRRFVEALELIEQLELKYPENPEYRFACVYAKSRSLWGLKKFTLAIDEMQSLVNIRPYYRSAQTLLTKWNGGMI